VTSQLQGRNSVPCAIYTRKSTEEGMQQDFNSLDAQREVGGPLVLSRSQPCGESGFYGNAPRLIIAKVASLVGQICKNLVQNTVLRFQWLTSPHIIRATGSLAQRSRKLARRLQVVRIRVTRDQEQAGL
jgi:hypothetical protein